LFLRWEPEERLLACCGSGDRSSWAQPSLAAPPLSLAMSAPGTRPYIRTSAMLWQHVLV
jgi:hypothetical protein